jgi:hypothetical protein
MFARLPYMSASLTSEGEMGKCCGANGDESHIRAIVFQEGDMFVAQCLEYDISTQAKDLNALMDRLDLTVEAVFAECREKGKAPVELIGAAPNYYHTLWDNRSVALDRVNVPTSSPIAAFALAKAA